MHRHKQLLLACALGTLSMLYCYAQLTWRDCQACDFTLAWQAARDLAQGQNPYAQIQPRGAYPYSSHFFYPLPAALAALPFACMPPRLAGALFFGLSAGLLAYGLLPLGLHRLMLFLSAPFLVAGALAQWSPLLAAVALLPSIQWLAVCKPNLGLAALVYRPTRAGLVSSLGFILLSLVILPGWPRDWLLGLRSEVQYRPPLLAFESLGFILLLAILRWRKPEGRLMLALSIIPQKLWFYDQLLLWLVPSSPRGSLALTALSWLCYGLWRLTTRGIPLGNPAGDPDAWIVALIYFPALILLFLERHLQSSDQQPEVQPVM